MENCQARIVGMPDRYTLVIKVENDQPACSVRFDDGTEAEIRRQDRTLSLFLAAPRKVAIGDSVTIALA